MYYCIIVSFVSLLMDHLAPSKQLKLSSQKALAVKMSNRNERVKVCSSAR